MSVAELKVISGGKQTFRTVEVVRQAESDRWAIVEAIEQDVLERLPAEAPAHAGADGINTGFYAICDEIADAIREANVDPYKAKTIAQFYRVAQAWPRDLRVKGATFGAHERLYAREDRVSRLSKLVDRSSDGRVNRQDVDLWLSNLKPATVRGFLDNVEHAVRSAVFSKGKPWSHVAQDDRDEIAHRLRRIAEEVQHAEGKFGK